jgi:hypothetical protein
MLEFVKCPNCGNERDFQVTLRYQRRPYSHDIDKHESYLSHNSRYRPDQINDQVQMLCAQCGASLTYGEARRAYADDAKQMMESAIIPAAPLPPVLVECGGGYGHGRIFASGGAYHICMPSGIADRAVPTGVVVDVGYLGKPDDYQVLLGALYHMDNLDLEKPSPMGHDNRRQGKMSFEIHDQIESSIANDNFFSPSIPSEMVERLAYAIYQRISLCTDQMQENEEPDLDSLFGSGNMGESTYGHSNIHPSRLTGLSSSDMAMWKEKARLHQIYRLYLPAKAKLKNMLPNKGWHAELHLGNDDRPFLTYTGRSSLRAMAKVKEIDGVPVYYTGDGWQRRSGIPDSAYSGNGRW